MSNVSEADVRAEVREWLAANWNPDLSLVEWRGKLADSGWGMPQWPKEWYGRGLPHALARAVEEEFANVGAVGVAKSGVRLLAAATSPEPPRARSCREIFGSSTDRRYGRPARITPTTACCSRAPIGTRPSMRGSRFS